MAIPDSGDVQNLADAARQLTEHVERMDRGATERDAVLARQSRTTRRLLWLSWAVLAALVGALVVGVVALLGVEHTAHRLDVSTTVSRQRALCPLYQVLLNADTPKARDRAADKAGYDRAYAVIHEGYKALDCDQFKGSAPKLG